MPYKARLKTGEARKRKKPGYRVTNARAYNQSLRKRGMISLYVRVARDSLIFRQKCLKRLI
ncbi:hypothetical protein QFZ94_000389 [Paraburkholderia sp. JPY465]